MVDNFEKQELKREPKSVEISMGTLFTVRSLPYGEETDRVDVITDIGEGHNFITGRVYEDKDGKYFVPVGTGGPEIFGQIVGQMSLQEMIKAFKLGTKKSFYGKYSKKTLYEALDNLRKSAKKGSRILNLAS